MHPLCILCLLAVHLTLGSSTCTDPFPFNQYTLTPPPGEYNGIDTTPISCFGDSTSLTCGGGGLLLGDGDLGSVDLDISNVIAWSETVDIVFTLSALDRVQQITLFFHNEPQQGVGLPPIMEFQWSANNPSVPDAIPLDYTLLGNQDLSQNDERLRNVTLSVVIFDDIPDYRYFRVHFAFPETSQINTILLSEVQLCGESVTIPVENITFLEGGDEVIQLGPVDDVVATIELSCTVANEGTFQFDWTFPPNVGSNQYHIRIVDANRTSIVQISQLRLDNGGDVVCQASYSSGEGESASRTITLDLRGTLQPLAPTVMTVANQPVTLGCELYGYVEESIDIIWQFEGNAAQLQSDSVYTISVESGNRSLQHGGDSPEANILSHLTIQRPNSSHDGTYICAASRMIRTLHLDVDIEVPMDPTTTVPSQTQPPPTPDSSSSPTPQPPTSGESEGSGGDSGDDTSLGLIIGVVAGALVVAIIVVVVLIIVIWLVRRRNTGHLHFDEKDYTSAEPFYAEVNKPLPPPLPKRFYTSPYATIDTPAQGNGQIELVNLNHNRASVCSAPPISDNPTLVRLKEQPGFLQTNPRYLSADNLDQADGAPPRKLRFGSVPSLDVMDSPNQSLLNIYARPWQVPPSRSQRSTSPPVVACPLYSEALTPSIFRQQQERRAESSPPDGDLHPYFSIYDDPKPLRRSEGPLEVPHQSIEQVRNLGMGQFGQVVLAKTNGLSLKDLKLSDSNDNKNVSILVAVKQLKPDADEVIKEAFEKEIKFMSRLNDDNVVRLLGICSTGNPFILMEYMENGDLNQYLHKHEISLSEEGIPEENKLPPSILLYMALQIASGMRYLASLRFIHRDLATRNCLVGENNVVKVADFGMSRSLYSSYYYRIRGRAMLPIRWMANECFYGKFSEKTDVWAFGVTMWEIFTFAKKQPYEGLTDQEVIDDAVKGPDRELPPRPEYCPPEVYEVMLQCWIHEPDERVKFEELHSTLQAIYNYSDIP